MLDSLFNEEVIMEMHDNSIRREAEEIGEKRGEKRGERRGIKKSAKNIAKKLLSMGSMPEEEIADVTGLTMAEVEKLKGNCNP